MSDEVSLNSDGEELDGNNKKRSAREKKPNQKFEDFGCEEKSITRPKTSFTIELQKKCEKLITKIKKEPGSDVFINSYSDSNSSVLSFGKIEKNLKINMYASVSLFGADIR
jgi:hypothetical protein